MQLDHETLAKMAVIRRAGQDLLRGVCELRRDAASDLGDPADSKLLGLLDRLIDDTQRLLAAPQDSLEQSIDLLRFIKQRVDLAGAEAESLSHATGDEP